MNKSNKRRYLVGYRKPPAEHQFRKGAPSPNPKGRPQKKNSVQDALASALEEPIVVTTPDGKKTKMTAMEIAIKKLINSVASGNIQSLKFLIGLTQNNATQIIEAQEQDPTPVQIEAQKDHFKKFIELLDDCALARQSGMFDLNDDKRLVPSPLGKPIAQLYQDLTYSRIRSAAEYRPRIQACVQDVIKALNEYAYDRIKYWEQGLEESDLE